MIRRKHRLYIDVTYSEPVTNREAAKALQLVLDGQKERRVPQYVELYLSKIIVKEFRLNPAKQ